MTINDFKTALNVQKEINGLHGLGTEKIEHTVTISDSAELRRTIDAAIAADPAIRDRITETLGTGEEEIE